jgi:hypothetical protein
MSYSVWSSVPVEIVHRPSSPMAMHLLIMKAE